MDADIAGSYRYPRRLIGSVFRVPDDDYRDILSPPIIDDDVVKRLSSTRSRAAPDSYSPYWEDRVKGVDTRSRELIRLASFQLALLNYVDLLGNGSAHGPDGELDEALKLAAHVTAQQVRASMALSLHCVELRRANAGSTLQRTCGQDLVTAMKNDPRAHASLFGDSFSWYVEVVADKVTKEKVLTDNLVTVSKHKKSKKPGKPSAPGKTNVAKAAAKAVATSSPAPSPNTWTSKRGPDTDGKGKGKKPKSTFQKKKKGV
jgi:hypothetical protein